LWPVPYLRWPTAACHKSIDANCAQKFLMRIYNVHECYHVVTRIALLVWNRTCKVFFNHYFSSFFCKFSQLAVLKDEQQATACCVLVVRPRMCWSGAPLAFPKTWVCLIEWKHRAPLRRKSAASVRGRPRTHLRLTALSVVTTCAITQLKFTVAARYFGIRIRRETCTYSSFLFLLFLCTCCTSPGNGHPQVEASRGASRGIVGRASCFDLVPRASGRGIKTLMHPLRYTCVYTLPQFGASWSRLSNLGSRRRRFQN
jgi:hypothetical protein